MTPERLFHDIGSLIQEARDLIAERNYQDAVWRCLIESQDGNNGWTKEIDAWFRKKPQTLKEYHLQKELRDVNLRAAKGLLEGISFVDHYLVAADVRAAEVCLARADAKNIPPELSEKLSTLLLQCEKY